MTPPRPRSGRNDDLKGYQGLGRYDSDIFYFTNPYTGKQVSLKTRDKEKAIALWAMAKALADKAYGDNAAAHLADRLQGSNNPKSKGATIHLCDFMKKWREDFLELGLVKVKIARNKGKKISDRTKSDYKKQCKQIEASPDARFPISSPKVITLVRKLLSNWIATPTHYNHLKAMLGRVFDHAVLEGLIEKNPMRDIDKLAVEERQVLIPDNAYVKITDKLMIHRHNKRNMNGEWRVKICELFYMFSQQPIDLFDLRMPQFELEEGAHGRIDLARSKTKVEGYIEMNAEMREVVDWLMNFRKEQLRKGNVTVLPETDHLLIYPAYMDKRSRWKAVQHRTFWSYWFDACKQCGFKNMWLMDLRKKGLTDEFVNQGENDKGLHDTQKMRDHYRLIKPKKVSKNTLKPIRGR